MITKYAVFNPLNGQYTALESIDSALLLRDKILNDYCVAQGLFQFVSTDEAYRSSQKIANEFMAIKEGIPETQYDYSVFNLTTQQQLSQVFRAENYLIKVSNGAVSEWYEKDVEIDGVMHSYVSRNVETGDPIEYYDIVGNVMSKYDLAGNLIVETHILQPVPFDKEALVNEFQHKESIFAWSDKSYGFIIEYKEPVTKPYADGTPEEQALLDAEKAVYFNNNKDLFPINQEVVQENGDSTWVLIG